MFSRSLRLFGQLSKKSSNTLAFRRQDGRRIDAVDANIPRPYGQEEFGTKTELKTELFLKRA